MKTMEIGSSGISTSVVALGAWAIGGDSAWGHSDDAESIRTIHRALDLGVTFVDTAPAYGLGHSEEVVGKALKDRRSRAVLSTKCGIRWDIDEGSLLLERDGVRIVRNATPASITEELEMSLRRLDTDYIDVYIVHWQAKPDFPVPIADTMGALARMKERGKIRAIGAANLSPAEFVEYTATGQLDIVQQKYSMVDRVAEEEIFPLCDRHGVTYQAYSPLERGVLTGKYAPGTPVNMGRAKKRVVWFADEKRARLQEVIAGWAPLITKYDCSVTQLVIAWTAAQGTRGVNVLTGARRVDQIEENAHGASIVIESEDVALMRADVEAIAPIVSDGEPGELK